MSWRSRANRSGDAVASDVDRRRAPIVERRSDVEGCGCLECRPVYASAIRRSLLDAVGWSVRLCLSRPSIFLLAVVLVAGRWVLATATLLPPPAAETLHGVSTFALLFLARGYVGTVAAGELTGRRARPLDVGRRVLARTPALIALGGLLVWLLLFGSSLAVAPVFGAYVAISYYAVPVPSAVLEALVVLVVASPILYLAFRSWFAIEACVVGRYGPVESLRVSWALTTTHRWKLLVALLPLLATTLAGAWGTGPGGDLLRVPSRPVVDAVATSAGELLSVLWYGVYAHLYVQGAVEG